MGGQSAKSVFPQSYKTIAVDHQLLDPLQGIGSNSNFSFIGFQVYQPHDLYAVIGLRVRLRMLFSSSVPLSEAIIYKIAVGSNGGGLYPADSSPSIEVNYAPGYSELDVTLDLKNLITPTGDNIVYLFFPPSLAPSNPLWSGNYNQLNINILKVDMAYQTVGIR